YVYGHTLISQSRSDAAPAWTPQYYGYDGQGTVRFLTDLSSVITDTYTYDTFGILLTPSSPPLNNSYLYCGQQFDRDLGAYFNRARYLNANSGRFWTMDAADPGPGD